MRSRLQRRLECSACAVGQASGVLRGQFCPFIERVAAPGTTIYDIGDPAERVWLVRAGTVVLSRPGETGSERARAVRAPGSFVGIEALVSSTYLEQAIALDEVALCGASLDGLDLWLGPKDSPARTTLELTLRARLADRAPDRAHDGPALARLARWLREEGPSGAHLDLPRHVIAELLGMRPETLSRALAELAERGAIEVTRTSLRVVDDGLLAEASRTDPAR